MPTPLPTIAGTIRIAFRGLVPSGRQWSNVWHARYAGGASAPGTTDVAALEALLSRLYTGGAFSGGLMWLTYCVAATTLIDSTTYLLNGTSTPQVIARAAAGSTAGSSIPSEVAHVLTLRTARRGRSYRGRVYLPCVAVSQLTTSGNLSATPMASVVAQANGIIAALGGPAVAPFWELGVASYLHSTFEPLTSVTIDAKPDMQRRRK